MLTSKTELINMVLNTFSLEEKRNLIELLKNKVTEKSNEDNQK